MHNILLSTTGYGKCGAQQISGPYSSCVTVTLHFLIYVLGDMGGYLAYGSAHQCSSFYVLPPCGAPGTAYIELRI